MKGKKAEDYERNTTTKVISHFDKLIIFYFKLFWVIYAPKQRCTYPPSLHKHKHMHTPTLSDDCIIKLSCIKNLPYSFKKSSTVIAKSSKYQKRCNRTWDIFFQHQAPTLPTMQLEHRPFSQRFRSVMIVAANIYSSLITEIMLQRSGKFPNPDFFKFKFIKYIPDVFHKEYCRVLPYKLCSLKICLFIF